jgi:hypothetical protein
VEGTGKEARSDSLLAKTSLSFCFLIQEERIILFIKKPLTFLRSFGRSAENEKGTELQSEK